MKRAGSFLTGLLTGLSAMAVVVYVSMGNAWLQGNAFSSLTVDTTRSMDELRSQITRYADGVDGAEREKFNFVYTLLEEEYFDTEKIDREKMKENALKGYVDALDDPYTVYLTPDENEVMSEQMEGSQHFEGIGAVVTKKDDGVLVEEVLKNMPAYNAGIQPLDLILEIDGESTASLGLNEAVMKIRGPSGSDVMLTIFRESEGQILEIAVTRGAIDVPSVDGEIIETGNVQMLYIEIATIGEDTKNIFREVLSTHMNPEVDGIIVDLRGNGGGYLPISTDIASFFIPEGRVITTARYTVFEDDVYESKGYGDLEGLPVVVLVDGLTASASEIIAAALQEDIGAVIVGTQTFGKGSIQTIYDLEDGSSMKYTIGKWFTPSNNNVNEVGLTPDVEVLFNAEGFASGGVDNQLYTAQVELLKLIESD